MYKVIKEFNNEDLVYLLGYELGNDRIYPKIEIYKNDKLFSGGYWGIGGFVGFFNFDTNSFYFDSIVVGTIKELFIKLRRYSEIPEYIEIEFEKIFLLYKRNEFKEF